MPTARKDYTLTEYDAWSNLCTDIIAQCVDIVRGTWSVYSMGNVYSIQRDMYILVLEELNWLLTDGIKMMKAMGVESPEDLIMQMITEENRIRIQEVPDTDLEHGTEVNPAYEKAVEDPKGYRFIR